MARPSRDCCIWRTAGSPGRARAPPHWATSLTPLTRSIPTSTALVTITARRVSSKPALIALVGSTLLGWPGKCRVRAATLKSSGSFSNDRTPTGKQAGMKSWRRFAPLYIALAVLAVYSTAPGFNFIGFDDMEILKQRYFIIGDLSKIKLAFTTDAFLGTNGSFYRPLQTVSFMLDALVGGPNPFIYHLTNLALYVVGSLCVYWLLLTLNYQRLSSLLLSLLFAL